MRLGKIVDVKYRRYIYDVAIVGGVALTFYGVITAEEAAMWGVVFSVILGLARVNVGDSGVAVSPDKEI